MTSKIHFMLSCNFLPTTWPYFILISYLWIISACSPPIALCINKSFVRHSVDWLIVCEEFFGQPFIWYWKQETKICLQSYIKSWPFEQLNQRMQQGQISFKMEKYLGRKRYNCLKLFFSIFGKFWQLKIHIPSATTFLQQGYNNIQWR